MRVFIYDELEREKRKAAKGDSEKQDAIEEVELMPGAFSRAIDGVYEKGIFTWKEGGRHIGLWTFGEKTKNMDILFNKTKRLPIGKKGEEVNCARAVFDGMNFVQIGWGLTSTITQEERQLSRANLVRDYENMKLSDDAKMTKPSGFLQDILPWLVIIACIVAIVGTAINANSIANSQQPQLKIMNATLNQNDAILKYLLANKTSANVIKSG